MDHSSRYRMKQSTVFSALRPAGAETRSKRQKEEKTRLERPLEQQMGVRETEAGEELLVRRKG